MLPTHRARGAKATPGLLMGAVRGPRRGDKNIDVQQETGFHFQLSCSFATSSVLTGGEPGGSLTT
jgi:hypothetical protein